MKKKSTLLSVIVPCYNEELNINSFYKSLVRVLDKLPLSYELIYVNDGSQDRTLEKLHRLSAKSKDVRVLNLSRNFGKEVATTAGIRYARGNALVMIDADGQHPAELIPKFVKKWQQGAQVVIGVREGNQKEGFVKKYGSKLFYKLLNKLARTPMVPGSTDYRLIDRAVQAEFILLSERNRNTRGLIDWLGFRQEYVTFQANPRLAGGASYSFSKLLHLALNSFVSLSLKPLYFSFYMGLVILPLSVLLALFSITEMLVGDPLNLHITGTAYLVMLALFLLGMVLISQGITALYLSHIHTETQNRPLYIVDTAGSAGIGAPPRI